MFVGIHTVFVEVFVAAGSAFVAVRSAFVAARSAFVAARNAPARSENVLRGQHGSKPATKPEEKRQVVQMCDSNVCVTYIRYLYIISKRFLCFYSIPVCFDFHG